MRYVIRGNTITLKVTAEKYSRLALLWGVNSTPTNREMLNPTFTNCTAGTDIVVNGLITKHGTKCEQSYTYTMASDGSQFETGEAKNYYQFQFYTVDNSGNIQEQIKLADGSSTVKSETVVVYQDKVGATKFDSYLSSKDATKPVIGTVDSITRADEIELVVAGEQKSDVEIEVSKDNILQDLGKTIAINNDSNIAVTTNTKRVVKFGDVTDNLGNVVTKLYASNCSTGTCTSTSAVDYTGAKTYIKLLSDGVYSIKYRIVDTAGNKSAWTVKTIIKDTIAPTKPIVQITRKDTSYTLLTLNISGENNAKARVKINGIEYLGVSNSSYNYKLSCGKSNSIEVLLEDRAENKSEKFITNIQSVNCPVITIGATPIEPLPNTGDVKDPVVEAAVATKKAEILDTLLYSDNGYQRCSGKQIETTMNLNPILTNNLYNWTVDEMLLKIKDNCGYSELSQYFPAEINLLNEKIKADLNKLTTKKVTEYYGEVSYDWIMHAGNTTGSTVQCTGWMSNVSDWLAGSAIGSGKKCTDEQKKAWQEVLPITLSLIVGALCVGGTIITIAICAAGTAVVMGAVNGIVQYSNKGYIDVGEMSYTMMFEFVATLGTALVINVVTRVGGVIIKYLVKSGKGSIEIAEKSVAKNLVKEEVETMLKANSNSTKEIVEVAIGAKTFTKLASGMLADDAIRPAITASNVDEQALRYLGKTFKIELGGVTKEISIPANYKYILANDGQGLVFYDGSKYTAEIALLESRGIYRIGNPQLDLPNGKFRYYNEGGPVGYNGQPLDMYGKVGGNDVTHFNLLGY